MMLIADSGSTKTNWLYVNDLERKKVSGIGLNLHYQSPEIIHKELARVHEALGHASIKSIYYYGTGISSEEKASAMRTLLQGVFTAAEQMEIASDLLGAAKALFGQETGLACILGTGAGSGLFQSEKIVQQVPSLGFWLGDEGSGAHLGKELVKSYLRSELDDVLKMAFEKEYGNFDRHAVFAEMSSNPTPNRYFASFTPFLSQHRESEFVKKLLDKCFTLFVEKNLLHYSLESHVTIGFVGSVAFYFKQALETVIARYLDNELKFLPDPIDSLADFHLNSSSKL
ncbi:N-acetylglucosamine kinase [Marinilongibacter aquaticus]|uniref:N-acetylglucosamine kinase n=1 Tax=Marinilongibacter aquaticus TaxID=2975157 RepID=UPI0021BD6F1C|nr:N-acetylglucosamine kinase [Marinilongibacter aquaticus]UBM57796.1 N-acetylglucosamine kinase [Marinilongibacter aquaticus]